MRNILNKNQNGITLIALVITIIVLLILAGVAISMLSGENGILKQAVKAKQETEASATEEAIKLAVLSALTVGKGEIQGQDAVDTLNNELKNAGYEGEKITELPTTIIIKDKEYRIDKSGTVSELITLSKLKETGEPVTGENAVLVDDKGDKITIPVNFNIASESPTLVTEGMIIEDSVDNQYVWIPVFTKEQYDWGADYSAVATLTEDTDEYYTAIQTALKNYTTNYKTSSYTDVWYGDASYGQYGYYAEEDTAKDNLKYYTNGNMTKEEYNTLYRNMLKSVYKNGGFYIGRYEMGIGVATSANDVNDDTSAQSLTRTSMLEYKASTTNENNTDPSIEGMAIPVSKANAVGYNNITQSQAQMLAKQLGKGADYSKVTTSIMFGVQWDAVCVFIEKFDNNEEKKKLAIQSEWLTSNDYSKLWGNYKNSTFKLDRGYYNKFSSEFTGWVESYTTKKEDTKAWLCTTGAVEQNRSLNIYDFAGNLSEWTLERYSDSDSPCVYRGDYFYTSYYASDRTKTSTYVSTYYYSSRSSLYIK